MILVVLAVACSTLLGCGERTESRSENRSESRELSPEQRFDFLLKKAEAGDSKAQLDVGLAYDSGTGVLRDAKAAVTWLEKAAAGNQTEAKYQLGCIAFFGKAMTREEEMDISWWLYEPIDGTKALVWWKAAAEHGHSSAQEGLSVMYGQGKGVEKNLEIAKHWNAKAVEGGNPNAQSALGFGYLDGKSSQKDVVKAVALFRMAAEQGHSTAQTNLGSHYISGDGVPKDAAIAISWFEKSAKNGNVLGQCNLALMYELGNGVSKDLVIAYAWYNIGSAATSGWPDSVISDCKKNRNEIELRLAPYELAEAQQLASKWTKGSLIQRSINQPGNTSRNSSEPLAKVSAGTAFLISKQGDAITNSHVVNGCSELRVQGRDGTARVVSQDKINDLALLRLPGVVSSIAVIAADPGRLRQGEDIVVFGYPLNSMLSSGGNLTPGVVSALTGLGNNTNQIQITAPIQPGSSGSSVLNKKGEVVAVVSMKLSDTTMVKATGSVGQNVNFAVSGLTLKKFLDNQSIEYRTGGIFAFDKSSADLAEEAKAWTAVIECWN